MTRLAIVNTSPLLAGGLAAALQSAPYGWSVAVQPGWADADAAVAHARDGADALALHASLPPTLPAVLLGDDLQALARRAAHDPRPLALLSPSASGARLQAAVAAVLAGLQVREHTPGWGLPPSALGSTQFEHEPLTPRELEVFELMGKGLSNRDIAGVLGISAHTAKFHVGQILAKVGAATRAEAVSSGLKLGLIGL